MANGPARLPHIFVTGTARVERYIAPGAGRGGFRLPQRARQAHGTYLLQQLAAANQKAAVLADERRALGIDV